MTTRFYKTLPAPGNGYIPPINVEVGDIDTKLDTLIALTTELSLDVKALRHIMATMLDALTGVDDVA